MNKQKRKQAAALSYDANQQAAPKLSAKGKGIVAENIIKKAKQKDIPILSDPTLLELLSQLSINETIPEELYEAVAEVFAFVYQIDQEVEKSKDKG